MNEHLRGATCRIAIVGLTVPVRVGVYGHEHVAPQPVVIDARLGYAFAPACADSYIDYDGYCTRLAAWLAQKPHTSLLETLAADIALWSFDTIDVLDAFSISLHKPKIRDNAQRLCVEFEWTRAAYLHAAAARAPQAQTDPPDGAWHGSLGHASGQVLT